jgi:hypothetical protein
MSAVVALALAAAGCGGGSKTLSKEEYGAKLNKICADLNAKNKEIGEPSSLGEVAAKGDRLLAEFDKAIAKAKKLKPPDEIKDAANRFISLGDQERGLISDLIDAAKKKDSAKIAELGAKIDPLDKESNDIAKNQLGAPACAQG